METLAKNLYLVLAFVAAVFVYILVAIQHRDWPLIVLGPMFIVGIVLLAVGWARMSRNPVQAVVIIQGSIIATVSLATSVIALGLWGEEVANRHFELLPPAERDTVGRAVVGAIGLLALFLLYKFKNQTNVIFPAGQTKCAFKTAFRKKITEGGSPGYQALYEEYMGTTKGWGIRARIKRAQVLETLSRPTQSEPSSGPTQETPPKATE
jgi:hypothetical protein